MKRFVAVGLATVLFAGLLSGCGQKSTTTDEVTSVSENEVASVSENEVTSLDEAQEEEENFETGDASLDDTRNQDEIGEKELLVVSFGTSYNDSRRLTIGSIEQKLDEQFGDNYAVRRAFTSQIIIDHVKKRDQVAIDNLKEALDRAVDNGVKTLVVQPTHLMNGIEYQELTDTLAAYADSFEQVAVGEPLLTADADFEQVMAIMTDETKQFDDGETAICFMGHGTEADSNAVYEKMQQMLTQAGYDNYFVGTVEATPSLEDVVAQVKAGNYKKVVLQPLMIVAGDHANNDMAGDEADSWKSIFEAEGYEVECVLRGLGEFPGIQELIAQHAQDAIRAVE